jgi:hypothetical protein
MAGQPTTTQKGDAVHLGRKILIGAAALALPASLTVVGFSGVASAAKAPPNPTTCKISAATINISPALTPKGVADTTGATGTTTGSVTLSGCNHGTPSPATSTFTVSTKAAKDTAAPGDGNVKGTKYLGLCAGFSSPTTVKSIGKSLKNLPLAGGTLKGAKAAFVTSPEIGFSITGTVKGGTNSTASHGATITVFLANTANNTNLIAGGCSQAGGVNHIDVDTSTSTATV